MDDCLETLADGELEGIIYAMENIRGVLKRVYCVVSLEKLEAIGDLFPGCEIEAHAAVERYIDAMIGDNVETDYIDEEDITAIAREIARCVDRRAKRMSTRWNPDRPQVGPSTFARIKSAITSLPGVIALSDGGYVFPEEAIRTFEGMYPACQMLVGMTAVKMLQEMRLLGATELEVNRGDLDAMVENIADCVESEEFGTNEPKVMDWLTMISCRGRTYHADTARRHESRCGVLSCQLGTAVVKY